MRASSAALAVELVGQLADPVFLELDQAAAERVGFDDIDAELEIGRMDTLDDVRLHHHQVVVAPLFAAVVLGGELHIENGGAHRAVVDDHAFAGELKKITHAENCR